MSMFTINAVRANLTLQKWRSLGAIEGRNSTVHVAKDPQLNEVLVLKEITKESLDRQRITNYFLEAQILNEGKHPHVMPIRYAAEDEENIYITMPYYEAGSINKLMESKFLTVREIIKYSLDFLSGLMYIHIKDMIHLDVKPTNIIINDCDRAILTDFGLSRYLDEYGLAEQDWQYRSHRSPEAYDTVDRSIQDDIYQAGITIYRMCNGNVEFKSQLDALIQFCQGDAVMFGSYVKRGAFPDRNMFLPHIPNKLRKALKKAIHPDTDKRYKTVLELINALSVIDENLDWEYTINTSEDHHSWLLNRGSTQICLHVKPHNGEWFVYGEKATSKRVTQIKKVKKNVTTLPEAFAHVEQMLSESL